MRQRKVKDLDEKLAAVSAFQVTDPAPGVWDRVFDRGEGAAPRDLYLEIGCGKGDFLLQQALAHPESDFIGIEGQASVVLRAMEKADRMERGEDEDMADGGGAAGGEDTTGGEGAECGAGTPVRLDNLRFACAFVNRMEELFAPESLSGIYLNFSDPWPKGRHAKRRLTWRGRLEDYARSLKPGGFIAFKTDNDALFQFTLEEIASLGWTPAEQSYDLHATDLSARLVMTEYETKFKAAGRPIHYVKVIV